MKIYFTNLYFFITAIFWLAGIVLAKGFWSTLVACVFPPWALYLVVEAVMKTYHLLGL